MKIHIEINYVGDGRVFLNFWNWMNGDDVVAELINGKLILDEKEITIQEFIDTVQSKFPEDERDT